MPAARRSTDVQQPTGRSSHLESLSKRELEVLHLVADGMTNRKIGSELGITERTAREHVARILLKLGIQSRVEAAVIATKWQLKH
ncbi:DNA-binding NarL/FixJ family response regulator [Kitasatospora sp. MAA19]|uniref:helix-turn-helix domain-containing protein n=1 Tax=unclassified Kitasatospora TaxID=2633591 RepID=UPI002474F5A6|nr:LuxR C-terminal-related transcriptional regulator [Kitasatospora sp. MAA19]MDH6711394.1 DNA-binding NarL/FixJ family response regulator [Kitasatospora sp. MAA19]